MREAARLDEDQRPLQADRERDRARIVAKARLAEEEDLKPPGLP